MGKIILLLLISFSASAQFDYHMDECEYRIGQYQDTVQRLKKTVNLHQTLSKSKDASILKLKKESASLNVAIEMQAAIIESKDKTESNSQKKIKWLKIERAALFFVVVALTGKIIL